MVRPAVATPGTPRLAGFPPWVTVLIAADLILLNGFVFGLAALQRPVEAPLFVTLTNGDALTVNGSGDWTATGFTLPFAKGTGGHRLFLQMTVSYDADHTGLVSFLVVADDFNSTGGYISKFYAGPPETVDQQNVHGEVYQTPGPGPHVAAVHVSAPAGMRIRVPAQGLRLTLEER